MKSCSLSPSLVTALGDLNFIWIKANAHTQLALKMFKNHPCPILDINKTKNDLSCSQIDWVMDPVISIIRQAKNPRSTLPKCQEEKVLWFTLLFHFVSSMCPLTAFPHVRTRGHWGYEWWGSDMAMVRALATTCMLKFSLKSSVLWLLLGLQMPQAHI